MRRVVLNGQEPAGDDGSGLTGPPHIPDPVPRGGSGGTGVAGRIRHLGTVLAGAAGGVVEVLRLVWQVSPALTAGLAVASIAMGLVPTATAAILRALVDVLVTKAPLAPPLLPGFDRTGSIAFLAGLQLAVMLGNAAAAGLRNIAQQLLQERVLQHVQLRVMRHAAALELAYFEDSRSYDLLRQAQKEASTRPVTMISGAFGVVQSLITVTSMAAVLAGLSPWLALLSLVAPVPAFVADSRYGLRNFFLLLWAAPTRRRMDYLATLVTNDTAAKEVKLFGLGAFFADRYRLLGLAFYRRLRRLVTFRYLVGAAWTSLTAVTGALLFLYVALQTASGRLSIGDLTLYVTAVTAVTGGLQTTLQGISGMYESGLFLRNLEELLDRPPQIGSPPRPRPAPARGHVVFDGVSFRYPGTSGWALVDVDLEIRPGEKIAIVGRNGAGKSTLIKLLCRLYDPQGGRVLIDGVDLREMDVDELRARIGAMFQDHITYQATAAENIGLGDVGRIEDRAAVGAAAERAGADELVRRLARGYDTPLGRWFDRGAELSGGEWQRLALARAFMRDVPLLLLDEPTAAMDARAEHDLFVRLRLLSESRTTLYVSHRFSTVRQADRILLLDGGRITENGTHEELMHRDGAYAAMFKLQASAYTDAYDSPTAVKATGTCGDKTAPAEPDGGTT